MSCKLKSFQHPKALLKMALPFPKRNLFALSWPRHLLQTHLKPALANEIGPAKQLSSAGQHVKTMIRLKVLMVYWNISLMFCFFMVVCTSTLMFLFLHCCFSSHHVGFQNSIYNRTCSFKITWCSFISCVFFQNYPKWTYSVPPRAPNTKTKKVFNPLKTPQFVPSEKVWMEP